MKFGVFCFYENYTGDFNQALSQQTELVKFVDQLGFDEAWLAEHHFNSFSICPSILLLATHLASVTERLRIGTAAILLPFHDPIKVAEDLATLDQLSNGRLNVGIAKGGPFPLQNKHFKVTVEESPLRAQEALEIVAKLLAEDCLSWRSDYYQLDQVTIYPKPLQAPIPFYLASASEQGVRYAAERGYGLMGAQVWPVDQLKEVMQRYRAINANAAPQLTLLRPFYVAESREAALRVAAPSLQRFVAKMQRELRSNAEMGGHSLPINVDSMLANAVVGSVAECREKIRLLKEELDVQSLVFRPLADTLQANLQSLKMFNEEVRPYV